MLVKRATKPVQETQVGANGRGTTGRFHSTGMKTNRRQLGNCRTAFLSHFPTRPSFLGNGPSSSTGLPQNLRPSKPSTSNSARQITISANSLEDSKRRARSQYDNIPDLNQQYISELNWVERKYGPKRLKKDIVKESQNSILRPEGAARPAGSTQPTTEDAGEPVEADVSQYETIRNQLIADTLFVGALGLCAAWGVGTIRDVQSFAIGLAGSVAYVVLLSRSVDRLADGARSTGKQSGDALQPARIAILVFLVLASAKNPDKVSVLPVLFGFFTYKLATLIPLLTGEAFE